MVGQAVYGIPELHRAAIKQAKVIANPGGFASAAILGMAPLVKAGLVDNGRIVVDGLSGTAGAGAELDTPLHHPEIGNNVVPYNVFQTADGHMILAVGYRVRSPRGTQFRQWATAHLAEYLVKGFVMDDERLKNPDGRPDYFDEMLARIRDIRASEKRFYQKVRDLFALAADYDKTDQATQQFFATVQNLLLYAVTQQTAAEIILARANPADAHFGLLAWG